MKHLACLEKLLDLGAKIDVHDVAGLKDGAVGTKNVVTRSKNVKKFKQAQVVCSVGYWYNFLSSYVGTGNGTFVP